MSGTLIWAGAFSVEEAADDEASEGLDLSFDFSPLFLSLADDLGDFGSFL